ncbi:response regulator [Pantanalinema sp. GBBB05]|uniref:response regulator n=1 Tax=Pantanalinema sp. GBBB05 TaxID=2604139 RepID=UPI001D53003A|nr:response regulator [Pantanalinema sp. GBBB05]
MSGALPRFDNLVVLLVETQITTVEAVKQCLKGTGAIVMRVASLQTAGERLSFIAPDIVITNLQLCEENGFILLKQVRAYERSLNRTQIPMIAIADYSDVEGEIALAAGFQAYIRTPIAANSLYATLRRFI